MLSKANLDLLKEMVRTDFKMRYNGSVLGFLWVLIKPLVIFAILYIVFSFVFSRGDSFFSLRLIIGLIIFTFFAEGTTHGVHALLSKAHIILKVKFPHELVIYSSIINSFITMVVSFLIFVIFWLITPTPITWLWLLIPVYIVILAFLIMGLSFYLSILSVRFRDLLSVWELFIQVLFYGSAVFYPISILPDSIQKYIWFNPLARIIFDFQKIVIDGQLTNFKPIMIIFFFSLLLFFSGRFYFKKSVVKVAEYY